MAVSVLVGPGKEAEPCQKSQGGFSGHTSTACCLHPHPPAHKGQHIGRVGTTSPKVLVYTAPAYTSLLFAPGSAAKYLLPGADPKPQLSGF